MYVKAIEFADESVVNDFKKAAWFKPDREDREKLFDWASVVQRRSHNGVYFLRRLFSATLPETRTELQRLEDKNQQQQQQPTKPEAAPAQWI